MWLNKYPILSADHARDLDTRAAMIEFEKLRPREEAEATAHKEYLADHHLAGAAHHYAGMRAARGAGDSKAAEKHSAMYEAHMRRAGHDPYEAVPDKVRHLADSPEKSLYRFKGHDADPFALGDHDPEDYSDDSEDMYDQVDDTLHKAESGTAKKLVGKRVSVHWNSTKQMYSVKHRGRVLSHVEEVRLQNAKFHVSEKGHSRALKGSRVGHAHVSGVVAAHAPAHTDNRITYNPLKHTTFVTRSDSKPVHRARTVHMTRAAIPGVAHGHRPRVSIEAAHKPLAKGDVVQFRGVKIPGKKQDLGADAKVIGLKPPLPADAGTRVWGPVKTGQVMPRQYRCTACGNKQMISTNHDGNVNAYCDHRLAREPGKGCSWKGIQHPQTGEFLPAGEYREFTRDNSGDDR